MLLAEQKSTGHEIAEKYADNLATIADLKAARHSLDVDFSLPPAPHADHSAKVAAYYVAAEDPPATASMVCRATACAVILEADPEPLDWWRDPGCDPSERSRTRLSEGDYWLNDAGRRAAVAEAIAHGHLLPDTFGKPFHAAVIDPAWYTLTAVGLAQAIYADRSFDHLPILADALEEAGCTDAAILDHCRQPGAHVRGCWLVDLLLAKS